MRGGVFSPPLQLGDFMIYLKNLNSQVREFKETDMRTVDSMVDSGRWTRVKGLKDWTPYSKPKKTKKKATKK
tara:strand:- start:618 stop:833 length:216 start_codon:yes stop_codon:yes gene_type:complete